jgi:hypothetical protein
LPEDVVEAVGLAGVEVAGLLDGFAEAAQEFRSGRAAVRARVVERWVGSLREGLDGRFVGRLGRRGPGGGIERLGAEEGIGITIRIKIRRRTRKVGADGQEQGEQALIEVLVNAAELVVAGDVVGGEAEPGEDEDQDEAVPGLEPPADGVKDHSMQ